MKRPSRSLFDMEILSEDCFGLLLRYLPFKLQLRCGGAVETKQRHRFLTPSDVPWYAESTLEMQFANA